MGGCIIQTSTNLCSQRHPYTANVTLLLNIDVTAVKIAVITNTRTDPGRNGAVVRTKSADLDRAKALYMFVFICVCSLTYRQSVYVAASS